MASLHLIRTSSFSSDSFTNALTVMKSSDRIILLDDGVYNINHPILQNALALVGKENLFVIEHHYLARGLATDDALNFISMAALVALTEAANQIITWQ
ncbi:sulfurtransferase complex subunit TusB [Thalassotalea montiporae]